MRHSPSFLEKAKLYPLAKVAVLLITGIVLGSHFAFSQTVVISLLAAFLLIALFSYRNLIVRDIFFYISIVILGIVLYYNSNNDFSLPTSKSSKFHAVLLSSPKQHGKIISCDIVVTSGKMTGKRLRASIMRDTIENRYRHLEIGSGIVANAVIEKPMNFKEGNFNYERFLKSHGISGMAFITIDKWITKKIPLSSLSAFDLLQLKSLKYREKFIQKYRISGLEDNGLAIVSAMTLGDKSMLDTSIRDRFSVTGASHVLAMSGLHLSILYLFLTFAWGRRKRWVAVSLFNIILIWTFVFISGMPISLVRSAIMLSVYCMLDVIHRNSQPLNTLALAALIVTISNPMSVFDVGFQMSFIAVFLILLLCPTLVSAGWRFPVFRFAFVRVCWNFIVVSCVAQLAVAPLVAYYFGRVSCYFLLSNAVVIPCTYVILIAGMLLLIIPFSAIQYLMAQTLTFTISVIDKSLSWIESLPGVSIENVKLNEISVFLIYILIAIICFFINTRIRKTTLFERL